MTFSLYDASAPVFVNTLRDMEAWLDKALAAEGDEAALMAARLAPDMHPLPRQVQIASDAAKSAVARLTGGAAPAMPDTEASFAELKARCRKTVDYIETVPAGAFDGADEREVELKLPNGMGYRFTGSAYLTGFALPNFFFHATMAYALLRASGAPLGKPDFLQHMGAPNITG